MIVVMSRKFFEKKVKKLAGAADYIGIDGENAGMNVSSAKETAIATRYSRMVTSGGFTPASSRMIDMLKKLNKDERINETRYKNEREAFLDDEVFTVSCIQAMKLLYSKGMGYHLNVFVILPNVVYKYLGEDIVSTMNKLANLDYRFVFSQKELKEFGFSVLEKELGKKRLREIEARVIKLERKHKVQYHDINEY